ncbi:hypothetical protein V8G54_010783 [Vigna mungo]|uniref:Uncharacterized protein n=1 Tax=Vigna mungo TaxID=3915 RepID=A0AAQ3NWG9_VIGMU
MDHSSAYGNHFFPYNAQPPQFNLLCEPFSEHSLQQPPHCFQPYCEQPTCQYDAPEQKEFQTVQPWQPTFCNQWQQGNPASDLQGLTTQVAQLVAVVNKLTRRAEEEKGATVTEAPLTVAAATKFQEIECPITSVYSNPSFTDSYYALNSVNSNSLMSDDCMSAFVDSSECVCESYDHNYTDEPQSEICCTADLNSDLKIEPIEVQTDFRKSKEYFKKMREAANHVLVLQYYEMDFDADVCEPGIDFTVFDHVHDVPVEVVDFNPCFDHSHITNVAFSLDIVHIHASSALDDYTDLNALLGDESDSYDDKYAVFDDVKVDMADFKNACTGLGLELKLEFVEFLNSVKLSNEKLNGCTCLEGGCEICEEINAAICSASNSFANVKEEFIMWKLEGIDLNEAAGEPVMQVYSEPSISTEFSEVQTCFNVFDLLKIESIEPIIDTVVAILVHPHHLDLTCSIEYFDIPAIVHNLCLDLDCIFHENLDDTVVESVEIGEVVFEEPVQVESNLELTTESFEILTAINTLHEFPIVSDISYNFETLDEISIVHPIKTPADGCSDLKAVFSDYMINDLLSDDDITAHAFMDTHADFELDVGAVEFSEKEAAGTEANLVEAGNGLNETQRPWNVQNQERLLEESWLLQQGAWKIQNQQLALDGELTLLQWKAEKNATMEIMRTWAELGKTSIRSFFPFLLFCSNRFLLIAWIIIDGIVNNRIQNMLFYIKIKKINFDLWPI